MAWLMTAAAVVTAGTGVATAIAGTADARKRNFYMANLEALDYDQKKKLNDDLIKASSADARQKILADTLGGISNTRVQTLGAVALEKEKTNKIVTIIGVGAGVLLLGSFVYILSRKKQ